MSLTTISSTELFPITTFTLTSNGVVQTGTRASVSTTVLTGIPTTETTTGPDTILFTTTINGSSLTGVSVITDTRTRTGTALPIRARSILSQGLILTVTSRTNVTIFTSVTIKTVENSAIQTQLTPVSVIAPGPTSTSLTMTAQSTITVATSVQTSSGKPSTSTSSMGVPSTTRSAIASTVTTSNQPAETTIPGGLPTTSRSSSTVSPSTSTVSTSSSRVPSTLVTMTKSSSPSSSSTAMPVPAMAPMDMHQLWWVALVVILLPLAIILLLWLWRKYSRNSWNRTGLFFHAIFETIGGMIFGKRWDKWRATRDENRRKKAERKNTLSPIEDERVRKIVIDRWHSAVENHRKEGNMPAHYSPPSTASGDTWSHRDSLLSRPQTVEMSDRGGSTLPTRPSIDISSNGSGARWQDKGKGRATALSPSQSVGTVPRSPVSDAQKREIASALPHLNEAHLNALGPQPADWPESPHPGVPWQPPDTPSLVSHNQWFPHDIRPAESRNLVHLDVAAKRADILRDINADANARSGAARTKADLRSNADARPNAGTGSNADATSQADVQSNASFRGARAIWPTINTQPLPQPAKAPPLAAALLSPSILVPEPTLSPDHPIMRLPSPRLLPPRELSSRPSEGLRRSPLHICRPSDTHETGATPPGVNIGNSPKEGPPDPPQTSALASVLGWKTSSNSAALASSRYRQEPSAPSPLVPLPLFSPYEHLAPPPPIPGSDTRRTSLSEWTDATVPGTTRAPTERAGSRSPPLGIERWNRVMAERGLGPGAAERRGSVESWEGTDHRRSQSVSPVAPLISPSQPRSQNQPQQPRVPGFNTARQSVTSAYSGFWEDDAGGQIEYDRHGRIRDVNFGDGARVGVASSIGEPSEFNDGERGRGRSRHRDGRGTRRGNDSDVDLDNKGYQRDGRGNWV